MSSYKRPELIEIIKNHFGLKNQKLTGLSRLTIEKLKKVIDKHEIPIPDGKKIVVKVKEEKKPSIYILTLAILKEYNFIDDIPYKYFKDIDDDESIEVKEYGMKSTSPVICKCKFVFELEGVSFKIEKEYNSSSPLAMVLSGSHFDEEDEEDEEEEEEEEDEEKDE